MLLEVCPECNSELVLIVDADVVTEVCLNTDTCSFRETVCDGGSCRL